MTSQAASNDKRFVIEETERACRTMAAQLDASELTRLLLPYIQHKNAKVSSLSLGRLVAILVTGCTLFAPAKAGDDLFVSAHTTDYHLQQLARRRRFVGRRAWFWWSPRSACRQVS